ncbi:MarR family winged helix-turn-helix transcriptional regulator [Streptoalloteichus hindustanus]|uniref:DNA-binding transcriptional regulator, MarR family n=1 Tax=Streptoalloteichus hindustanus TaxID=2017 RepID=A0A1M4Y8J3_STRHI|nr:MarR family transcriptional regulator [Streptoalloteichus hindustanus]SHF02055.1 DNA-binding transcriptional regulator, MarR family [Streptoalloteichus hindustanus]
MAQVRDPHPLPADLPAAVAAAAEALVTAWGHGTETTHPKVSPSQLRALLVVERHHDINLGGLAEELGAIPSSASRLCDRLQAAGLLARRGGRADRREVTLTLTGDGQRVLNHLRTARRAELGRVLDAMTLVGRSALLAGLEEFRAVAVELGLVRQDPG